jgi:hypothetical protein
MNNAVLPNASLTVGYKFTVVSVQYGSTVSLVKAHEQTTRETQG